MKKPIIILIDDIHLEGRENSDYEKFTKEIENKIESLKQDNLHPILVCAGDIAEGVNGIEWAAQFKTDVVYVCGNHEFWHNDYYETIDNIYKTIATKKYNHIHFLHNDSVIIKNIRFIGATLWTDLGSNLPWYDKNHIVRFYMAMGDFRRGTAKKWYTPENIENLKNYLSRNGVETERINDLIKNQYFNPLLEFEENKKSANFIEAKLEEPFDGQTVVVTHHLPFKEIWMKEKSISLKEIEGENINNERKFYDGIRGNNNLFKDILMLGFYANDLSRVLYKKSAPSFWFHGHLHSPIDEVMGKTKIISSPVGYRKQSSEIKYKIIDVDMDNNNYVKEFLKKEIQNYDWSNNLLANLRELERIIKIFQTASITGLIVANDFEPILKKYQEKHLLNLENLNNKLKEWFKIILYSQTNNVYIENQNMDYFILKKLLGILEYKAKNIKKESDKKYRFPESLAAIVNEYSFMDIEEYNDLNRKNFLYCHYTEWLKELQQIQIQISIFKQFLLDFIEYYDEDI